MANWPNYAWDNIRPSTAADELFPLMMATFRQLDPIAYADPIGPKTCIRCGGKFERYTLQTGREPLRCPSCEHIHVAEIRISREKKTGSRRKPDGRFDGKKDDPK